MAESEYQMLDNNGMSFRTQTLVEMGVSDGAYLTAACSGVF